MIVIHILLLVASISAASQDLAIDWNRCNYDTVCHVMSKCLPPYDQNDTSLTLLTHVSKLQNNDCGVGVQAKPFTQDKILFIIQIRNVTLHKKMIGLYQGDYPILHCEENNTTIEVKVDEPTLATLKPKLYEQLSRFNPQETICAFTVTKATQLAEYETTLFSSIRFDNTSYTYYLEGTAIYAVTADKVSCDPGLILDQEERTGLHVLPVPRKDRLKIDCANIKHKLDIPYQLYIENAEDVENRTSLTSLECNKKEKTYTGKDKTSDVPINQHYSLSAYCAVDITKSCENNVRCTGSCPMFTKGNDNDPAKLECAGGKWLINNEYYVGIQPECKEDEVMTNTASFFITLPGGIVQKLTEGQCFTEYDCELKTKLDIAESVSLMKEKVTCKDGYVDMRIKSGNTTYNASNYTCDKATGYWINEDENIVINEKSRVVCKKKAAPEPEVEYYSLEFIIEFGLKLIGGIIGGVILGFLLSVVVFHSWFYVRISILLWRILTNGMRVKAATFIFNKASVATLASIVKIIHGLELLDAIFRTSTEDPQIWEMAYRFLDRLHGSSRTRGNRVTGLLSRYLYLQARRLIDKHGWTSPNRVTKTNYEGYIRTAIIRLIFYFRFNDYTEEATKFIGEGFAQLRYNAVEQYPHCGALWAHVATCRSKAMQRQFLDDLKKVSDGTVVMDIPETDRFDEIGNISDQAKAAIGGALFWEGKSKLCKYTNNLVTMGLACIKGMLRSTHYDMGVMMKQIFMDYTDLQTAMERMEREGKTMNSNDPPPDLLETKLNKILDKKPLDEFLDFAVRILFCYGQRQEAKTMENMIVHKEITTGTKLDKLASSARFVKINAEQQRFQKALAEEEEKIIKWLVARMDKKEYKDNLADRFINHAAEGQGKNDGEIKEFWPCEESKVLETDDAFFTTLLRDPIVIPRIRTCHATEEEQKRYKAILNDIFSLDTLIAVRVNFAPDDVMEILSKTKEIVKTEPVLIEDIPAGITVVTDLHGQLYDLYRVFQADSVDGKPGYECTKYLFLGDFVDRGKMSLEVVMTLFILKTLYPDRIILLRGNHDFTSVNSSFREEMLERYDTTVASYLYVAVNDCFAYLSLAGIIGNKIFCAHAGISTGSFTRHEMRRLEKPYSQWSDPLIRDLVWSDPALNCAGVSYNVSRHNGIEFGEDAFIHAMENIGCEMMIRGHQIITAGKKVVWDRLICVFTVTAHAKNDGTVVLVDENLNINFRIFESDTTQYKIAKHYDHDRKGKPKAAENGGNKSRKVEKSEEEIGKEEVLQDVDEGKTVIDFNISQKQKKTALD